MYSRGDEPWMIWMMIMMLAKFIAEPCRKISRGALINKLIVCMTIFDQELIQSFLISFKVTRYLLSDAMVALHWTSGVNHPPYRSISIDIFISIITEAWLRSCCTYQSVCPRQTCWRRRRSPPGHTAVAGEHTGTRASGRERAARSLRSAAMTSRTFIQTQLCISVAMYVTFNFRI